MKIYELLSVVLHSRRSLLSLKQNTDMPSCPLQGPKIDARL